MAMDHEQMPQDSAEDAGSSGGGVGQVIVSVDKGLAQLAKAAAGSQSLPPGVADKLAQLSQEYRALVDALMSQGEAQGGTVAPEQGASGAVPQSMMGKQ